MKNDVKGFKGIAIFMWRVTGDYVYNLFKKTFENLKLSMCELCSMKYMPVLDPAPTNVQAQHTSKEHNGLARTQKDQNGIYRDQNGHVRDYSAVVREHNTVVRDQNGIVTTNGPNREQNRPREPGLLNLREFRKLSILIFINIFY